MWSAAVMSALLIIAALIGAWFGWQTSVNATLAAASLIVARVGCSTSIEWALRLLQGPRKQKPEVHGGTGARMQAILNAIPTLQQLPRPPLGMPGMMQMVVLLVHCMWQEWRFEKDYDVEVEEIPVTLPGTSAFGHADVVRLRWVQLKGTPGPADDAPIAVVCPGLSCYAASLPGTSTYPGLLAKGYRVVVFEKRGVGPAGTPCIRAPIVHLFGHPSDLHTAMLLVQDRYPSAPIHIVSHSSGNGLAGSYASLYAGELRNLRSALLLIGGEDYNVAFTPPKRTWLTPLLFETCLLPTAKTRFVVRNKDALQKHSKEGYEELMAAETLQELYNKMMLHFSGYSDRAEAERRLNAFSGGNECLLSIKVPFFVAFTKDDPVAPGGPKPSWVKVISKCERAALALFPSGSHCACYDGWRMGKWIDALTVEWIEAVEADGGKCRVPCATASVS